MLDQCSELACTLSLTFNVNKCHCIAIGKLCKTIISPMILSGKSVEWCSSIKYLGIHIVSHKTLKFDVNPLKRAFYAACNSIFMHGSAIDDIALLTLQETYSLSVLMYAVPVISLTNRQIDEINVCWNNVIRRIFGYNKWESVKAVLFGLGRFNVKHLIMYRQSKLYRRMYFSTVSFIHNLFYVFMLHSSDCLLRTVFCTGSDTFNFIWSKFDMYVNM